MKELEAWAERFELEAFGSEKVDVEESAIADEKLRRILLRSRRLRLLDWMSQVGLSLLNVMPHSSERFLECISGHSLVDKYKVPLIVASRLPMPTKWLTDLLRFESFVVVTRQKRLFEPVALKPNDFAKLATGVHLFEADAKVVAIHDSLPTYGPSETEASRFWANLNCQSETERQGFVAVESSALGDGFIAELEPSVYRALKLLEEGLVFQHFVDALSKDDVCEELLAAGLVTK